MADRLIIKSMKTLFSQNIKKAFGRGVWRLLVVRQKVVNWVLSSLYGQKMMVLPAGHVGLAGALVLWLVQDGGRQLVMVRSPKARDSRARLVSFMGMGRHADMSTAMKAAVKAQLGESFTKTLKLDKVSLDRVAAAPMFTYTDEDNGIVTPVQVLMWTMQVQPLQLELLKLAEGQELVLVNEQALLAGKVNWVAPTHAALWRSVQRHLPQKTFYQEDDAAAREERRAEAEALPTGRILH